MKKDLIINEKTRIYKIKHFKPLKDYKLALISPRNFAFAMGIYRLKDLKMFYPVNAKDIRGGFNFLKNRVLEGKAEIKKFSKNVQLLSFINKSSDKPYILILPGGGYHDVAAMVEGFPVANYLYNLGYSVFIGLYSINKEAIFPKPLEDVNQFLTYIDENAERFHVNKGNYILSGFSAGGHLATMFASKSVGYEVYKKNKPKGLLLGYPMVSLVKNTYSPSLKVILGKENVDNSKLKAKYSIDTSLTSDFPPAYYFQAEHDSVLPYSQGQYFDELLSKYNVPHVFITISGKEHGNALARGSKAENWLKDGVEFINNHINK